MNTESTPNPLQYATPEETSNIDGLLDTGKYLAILGLLIPLAAPAAIAWAVFGLCQANVAQPQRNRAIRIIVAAVVSCLINFTILVTIAIVLQFPVFF